jgi:hypothetical protein
MDTETTGAETPVIEGEENFTGVKSSVIGDENEDTTGADTPVMTDLEAEMAALMSEFRQRIESVQSRMGEMGKKSQTTGAKTPMMPDTTGGKSSEVGETTGAKCSVITGDALTTGVETPVMPETSGVKSSVVADGSPSNHETAGVKTPMITQNTQTTGAESSVIEENNPKDTGTTGVKSSEVAAGREEITGVKRPEVANVQAKIHLSNLNNAAAAGSAEASKDQWREKFSDLRKAFQAVDKTFAFNEAILAAAADFIFRYKLDRGYFDYIKEKLDKTPNVRDKRALYSTLIEKDDLAETYLAIRKDKMEKEKKAAEDRIVVCPACNKRFDSTHLDSCPRCGLRTASFGTDEIVSKHRKLAAMPEDVREEYNKETEAVNSLPWRETSIEERRQLKMEIDKKYGLTEEGK